MTDEKSILEQFAAGNHTAFRELFMRYHLKVYYFVLGLVKSESDAEDLTQEIFLKLWTHRSRFTEVRTFGSYLYVLAKHSRRMPSARVWELPPPAPGFWKSWCPPAFWSAKRVRKLCSSCHPKMRCP